MFKILMIIGLMWCGFSLDLSSDCNGHYCGATTTTTLQQNSEKQ